MEKLKKNLKSIQSKLFLFIVIIVLTILIFLVLINNIILDTYYLHNRKGALKAVYEQVNELYNNGYNQAQIDKKLERIEAANNFEFLIQDGDSVVYSSDEYVISGMEEMAKNSGVYTKQDKNILELSNNMIIRVINDNTRNMDYLLISSQLDNGYAFFARMPIADMHGSVEIANVFLCLMAGFIIIISAIIIVFVSKSFKRPISELNNIAKKMSNLDFSTKYIATEGNDEINSLGKSINTLSSKLEKTIQQLRDTNVELEKDIEEKSKIDEMRRSFISDVSHELKTPIALIQGYSEGLLENVNKDEENRKFYAEVIQDEAEKMDRLVKQLLELMNLEYGKREFNNEEFDIVELEKEVLRKSTVMINEKNIKVEFNANEPINVFADDFYIEQVFTNYITNAIKHAQEINGDKIIKIENTVNKENGTVRIKVFNTGENIKEEEKIRIWNRFYKGDEARSRTDGSTGIGLSIVKAIMNNYKKDYGFTNMVDGVEFYFELDLAPKE